MGGSDSARFTQAVTTRRLAFIALLGLLIGLLGLLPPMRAADELIYDAFLRWQAGGEPAGDIVLAAFDEAAFEELGPWPWSTSKVTSSIRDLLAARPSALGLDTQLSELLLAAGPSAIAELKAVVSGVPLVLAVRPDPGAPDAPRLRALEKLGIEWGFCGQKADSDGVLRRVTDGPVSYESLLAGKLGMVAPQGTEPIRIRFSGPARSLPQLPVRRLARGELPPSAFAGKVVLTGITSPAHGRLAVTPTTLAGIPMAEPEISGHALVTIASGRFFRRPDGWTLAALYGGTGALFLFLIGPIGVVGSYLLLALALLATVAVSAALFAYHALLVPVSSLLLLDLVLFAAFLRAELLVHEERTKRLILQLLANRRGSGRRQAITWKNALGWLSPLADTSACALIRLAGRREFVEASRGFTGAELARMEGRVRYAGFPGLVTIGLETGGRTLGYWVFKPASEPADAFRDERLALLEQAGSELAAALAAEHAETASLLRAFFRDPSENNLQELVDLSREAARERDYFAEILERLGIGVCAATALGEVTFVNSAFARAVGRPRDEAVRTRLHYLLEPIFGGDPASVRSALEAVTAREAVLEREFSPPGSGSTYLAAWSSCDCGEARGPAFFSTVLDVTRHRALEQLKGQVLGRLTARLRDLLATVQGPRGDRVSHETAVAEALIAGRTVQNCVSQLSRIFEEIASVAAVGISGREPRGVPLDLVEVAREAVEAARDTAAERECAVELDPAPKVELARGDPLFVEQCVESLLRESLAGSPAGGRVHVSVNQTGQTVYVEILNDGYGMPEAAVARLFEGPVDPLAGHAGGKLEPRTIQQALAAMHGGVEAEASVGQGTRFRMWLPAS